MKPEDFNFDPALDRVVDLTGSGQKVTLVLKPPYMSVYGYPKRAFHVHTVDDEGFRTDQAIGVVKEELVVNGDHKFKGKVYYARGLKTGKAVLDFYNTAEGLLKAAGYDYVADAPERPEPEPVEDEPVDPPEADTEGPSSDSAADIGTRMDQVIEGMMAVAKMLRGNRT